MSLQVTKLSLAIVYANLIPPFTEIVQEISKKDVLQPYKTMIKLHIKLRVKSVGSTLVLVVCKIFIKNKIFIKMYK